MKRLNSKVLRRIAAFSLCAVLTLGQGNFRVNATETETVAETTTSDSTDTTNVDANGTLGKNSDVGIEVTKSITGKAGKDVKVAFVLKSNNTETIKVKSVYPVIDATFPFETSGDAYKVISAGDDTEKQASLSASFKMKTRSDIETGYHSVRFIGEYSKIASDGTAKDYYVIKTINIYFTGTTTSNTTSNSSSGSSSSNDDDDDDYDSGSSSGGGYSSYDDDYDSGSDDSGSDSSDSEATAPKLIITGYDTKPEKIMAGEKFTITIHVQNTSKTTNVCNAKFLIGNEAGNFMPTSGSSAVFVESIPAGKTGDIKIEMKTSSDLAQKNYVMVVKGDFDDGKGNNFTSSDNLSVPVYQEVKLGITEVTMTPEMLGVGSEASLMFTINNQGSAGIYNVNVAVKDDAVTGEDCYVGNIAGNSSAYATLILTGAKDNSDKGNITVEISYEDSEGNKGTVEQTIDCVVGEDVAIDMGDDMDELDGEDGDYEEDEGLATWVKILIGVIAAGAVVAVIVVIVIKRKKRMEKLFEDGEDDLDDEDF